MAKTVKTSEALAAAKANVKPFEDTGSFTSRVIPSACLCCFRVSEAGEWSHGIAITTQHGLSEVIAIFPQGSTTGHDMLPEIFDYRLDWSHSLDLDRM